VEVLDSGWYQLGCSQGILDIHQAADLKPVEAEYSELEDIPETTISLTAVIRGQSWPNMMLFPGTKSVIIKLGLI